MTDGPGSYADLGRAWRALRSLGRASVREVACVGVARTLLVAEIPHPQGSGVVTLSAGVHGDEPAGPWALLSLVRDGLLDPAFGYRIWACTNPSGYAAGTRESAEGTDINRSFQRGGVSPEARAIVTANRDRRFALALDLHEDIEATGFYAYEPALAGVRPFGADIVRAMDDAGLPVQELDDAYDLGYAPEAHHLRELRRGLVVADPDAERAYFDHRPYSLYVSRRAAERVLTLEAPATQPWNDRIAILRLAVVTAVDLLAREKKSL